MDNFIDWRISGGKLRICVMRRSCLLWMNSGKTQADIARSENEPSEVSRWQLQTKKLG